MNRHDDEHNTLESLKAKKKTLINGFVILQNITQSIIYELTTMLKIKQLVTNMTACSLPIIAHSKQLGN